MTPHLWMYSLKHIATIGIQHLDLQPGSLGTFYLAHTQVQSRRTRHISQFLEFTMKQCEVISLQSPHCWLNVKVTSHPPLAVMPEHLRPHRDDQHLTAYQTHR